METSISSVHPPSFLSLHTKANEVRSDEQLMWESLLVYIGMEHVAGESDSRRLLGVVFSEGDSEAEDPTLPWCVIRAKNYTKLDVTVYQWVKPELLCPLGDSTSVFSFHPR